MPHDLSITICMGSSCYSRGNRRNIEVIQKYLADEKHDAMVQVVGHLCEDHCLQGPNVQIAGVIYHAVDSASVVGLLRHHLKNQDGGSQFADAALLSQHTQKATRSRGPTVS